MLHHNAYTYKKLDHFRIGRTMATEVARFLPGNKLEQEMILEL